MKSCYINSVGCISAQKTLSDEFLNEVVGYETNVMTVIAPNYKDFIPPAAARRMAKGVKMGVVASKIALDEADIELPDAIITGTGLGCVIDSEKFVRAIIDNNEEFLTPTSFIQSTHNTVGAQVALGLKCKAYNFTYVHEAISFESSLVDAQLLLDENEASNVLVGGIDELGDSTIKFYKRIKHIKEEEVETLNLDKSSSKGAVFGEGAAFFVLSDKKQENTYAELIATETFSEVALGSMEGTIHNFLSQNEMSIEDIDAVLLGKNGDNEFDTYYMTLQETIFKDTLQLYYKHLSGEYNTASSFGFWVASKLLKLQTVPDVLKLNNVNATSFKNVLLYNQYRGKDHSLVLLKSC